MISKIIMGAALGTLLFGSVHAQKGAIFETPKKIEVRGEIIAEDSFAPTYYLESFPPHRLYLLRITDVLAGTESGQFVLISHRPSKEQSLIKTISKGRFRFEMTLARAINCDSSINDIWTIFSKHRSDRSNCPLKWFRTDLSVPMEKTFSCYFLNDANYQILAK